MSVPASGASCAPSAPSPDPVYHEAAGVLQSSSATPGRVRRFERANHALQIHVHPSRVAAGIAARSTPGANHRGAPATWRAVG